MDEQPGNFPFVFRDKSISVLSYKSINLVLNVSVACYIFVMDLRAVQLLLATIAIFTDEQRNSDSIATKRTIFFSTDGCKIHGNTQCNNKFATLNSCPVSWFANVSLFFSHANILFYASITILAWSSLKFAFSTL